MQRLMLADSHFCFPYIGTGAGPWNNGCTCSSLGAFSVCLVGLRPRTMATYMMMEFLLSVGVCVGRFTEMRIRLDLHSVPMLRWRPVRDSAGS